MNINNSKLLELFIALLNECENNNIEPRVFNLVIHEDVLEIYTAEEHDSWEYHGAMGNECHTKQEVVFFVKSVVKQGNYYKKKMEV